MRILLCGFGMLLSLVVYAGPAAAQTMNTQNSLDSSKQGILIGSIFDGMSGKPVPARVYVIGRNDSLYMADDCIPYDKPNFITRIGYGGRHFTTRGNSFTVRLPEGRATVVIERGKEFIPIRQEIMIKGGTTVARTFVMRRWIDMASKGWYSGDLHVHRPPGDMGELLIAEDLNLAEIQTVWSSAIDPDLDLWLKKADTEGVITVDNRHIYSVLSHEIERMANSAALIHHTGKTVFPIREYVEKNLPGIPLFEKARSLGGYSETEKPWWPESHIDIAVGQADFVGIANNHFTYKSYLPEHNRERSEFKSDYPEGMKGYVQYVCDLYYAYLNCGFPVRLSAGSASGVLPNPPGYNRIYAQCNNGFSYSAFFKAMKAGHSFVTNGPMFIMSVDGCGMGDTLRVGDKSSIIAHVQCELHSHAPIDRVEIIRDGEIVKTIAPKVTGYSAILKADIPVSRSGWIAARCFEKRKDTVRFAHTSPVVIEITTKPFVPKLYAAEYFTRKTQELIDNAEKNSSLGKEEQSANLEIYRRALAVYGELVKKSRER
jgi:hypothetical protein